MNKKIIIRELFVYLMIFRGGLRPEDYQPPSSHGRCLEKEFLWLSSGTMVKFRGK